MNAGLKIVNDGTGTSILVDGKPLLPQQPCDCSLYILGTVFVAILGIALGIWITRVLKPDPT